MLNANLPKKMAEKKSYAQNDGVHRAVGGNGNSNEGGKCKIGNDVDVTDFSTPSKAIVAAHLEALCNEMRSGMTTVKRVAQRLRAQMPQWKVKDDSEAMTYVGHILELNRIERRCTQVLPGIWKYGAGTVKPTYDTLSSYLADNRSPNRLPNLANTLHYLTVLGLATNDGWVSVEMVADILQNQCPKWQADKITAVGYTKELLQMAQDINLCSSDRKGKFKSCYSEPLDSSKHPKKVSKKIFCKNHSFSFNRLPNTAIVLLNLQMCGAKLGDGEKVDEKILTEEILNQCSGWKPSNVKEATRLIREMLENASLQNLCYEITPGVWHTGYKDVCSTTSAIKSHHKKRQTSTVDSFKLTTDRRNVSTKIIHKPNVVEKHPSKNSHRPSCHTDSNDKMGRIQAKDDCQTTTTSSNVGATLASVTDSTIDATLCLSPAFEITDHSVATVTSSATMMPVTTVPKSLAYVPKSNATSTPPRHVGRSTAAEFTSENTCDLTTLTSTINVNTQECDSITNRTVDCRLKHSRYQNRSKLAEEVQHSSNVTSLVSLPSTPTSQATVNDVYTEPTWTIKDQTIKNNSPGSPTTVSLKLTSEKSPTPLQAVDAQKTSQLKQPILVSEQDLQSSIEDVSLKLTSEKSPPIITSIVDDRTAVHLTKSLTGKSNSIKMVYNESIVPPLPTRSSLTSKDDMNMYKFRSKINAYSSEGKINASVSRPLHAAYDNNVDDIMPTACYSNRSPRCIVCGYIYGSSSYHMPFYQHDRCDKYSPL